ncbi:hypothetical protein O3P69_002638 [Scylla paramamosain]|uniref:FAR1 domain-containing protein n=1 Tax=Scylla paramamosain TaxID=85552 RepID=A0AAW0ULR2_SCYPA
MWQQVDVLLLMIWYSKCQPIMKEINVQERVKGTCKIGQSCTSFIEMERSDGRICMTYFVDNHDHDINLPSLAHMNLPKCDRDKIAGVNKLYFILLI